MHAAFNQDASCCVTGTEHGFRVYNCSPFGKFYASESDDTDLGGVGSARMSFATSLVAVVGNGESNSPRRLAIVNTRRRAHQTATMCELTFPTAVRNSLLNRRRLVVVLDAQIYIYNIANMKSSYTLETVANRGGVASVTPNVTASRLSEQNHSDSPDPVRKSPDQANSSADQSPEPSEESPALSPEPSNHAKHAQEAPSARNWLVYPAGPPPKHHLSPPKSAGDVPKAPQGDVTVFDMDALAPVTVIRAHRSPVASSALNEDGTLLATTSDKGTLIRVFSVPSGTSSWELRRGSYQSRVYSISFSLGSKSSCVSSATQTVHIYKLDAASRVKRSKKTEETTESSAETSGAGEAGGDDGNSESADQLQSQLADQSADQSINDDRTPESGASDTRQPSLSASPGDAAPENAAKDERAAHKHKKRWFSRKSWSMPSDSTQSQQRDFAWFKSPSKHNVRTVVGMAPLSNLVYVAAENGRLFHYAIDLSSGGECANVGEYEMD